jgi:hypothetical protein
MSLNKRWRLLELRVICAVAGEWGKPTCNLLGLIPICQNQSQKVQTVALKLVIPRDGSPENCG